MEISSLGASDRSPGLGSSVEAHATEGVVLLARYELKVRIGEGGMGVVWKAVDRTLGNAVAVKVLKAYDETSRQRFLEEARITAQLSSPHVVRVFDAGISGRVPFLVMEYLEGVTLRELLLVRGALEPNAVVSLVQQVADGLTVAHEQGVVHRDIKPANLYLVGREHLPFIKILDFGVAKAGPGEWTATGAWLGTPHYVSPEQARDASRADPSADIWALAVVAFECLTGHRPFDSSNATGIVSAILSASPARPSSLNGRLPEALDDWARRAFRLDRSLRFPTAQALSDGLREALLGTSGSARVAQLGEDRTQVEPPRGNFRRSFAAIVGAASLGFALARWGIVRGEAEATVTPPLDCGTAAGEEVRPAEPAPCAAAPTATPIAGATVAAPAESILPPPKPVRGGRAHSIASSPESAEVGAKSEEELWRRRL